MGSGWLWLSFCDSDRPEGERFLGVACVQAPDVGIGALVAHTRGCNPGGQVMAAEVPEEFCPPPPELDHRLVSDKHELDRLVQRWHGCGIVNLDGEPV